MTDPTPRTTVAEAFYDVLRAHGITRIFGNPGSNELTMLKHLPGDIEYVLALNEGAALAMAEGYANATGTVGVVNLHSSSGTGNAMGALTNSSASHAPVVILSGQQSRRYVPFAGMLANVEPTILTKPLVKWAGEPLRPEDTPRLVSQAILLATSAPAGPVFLSVPLDDWARPADTSDLDHLRSRRVHGDPVISSTALEQLATALDSASSPVLVLGPGVDDDQGWAAAIRLAEARSMPVWIAPSPSRAPFPTRHRLFQGLLPTGLGAVAEKLRENDLVLTFGAAVFRYHQFVEGEPLDVGSRLMGVTYDPDEAAHASTGELFIGNPSDAIDRLAAAQADVHSARVTAPRTVADDARVGPFAATAILDAVDRGKSRDSIVVLEWTSADALWPRLSFDRPGSYYFPASGGLGWGLPAAIGIAMGAPNRPVVALIGDGAMQYTPAALWTAARQVVPVTFIIAQNEEYGALRRFAGVMGTPAAPYLDIPHLDPVAIASGYGIDSRRVETLEELEVFVREGAHAIGPRLAVVAQAPSQ